MKILTKINVFLYILIDIFIFRKRDDEGYGFSVRGDAPVVIAGVESASLAHVSVFFLVL